MTTGEGGVMRAGKFQPKTGQRGRAECREQHKCKATHL
jgi:hypothetical protein